MTSCINRDVLASNRDGLCILSYDQGIMKGERVEYRQFSEGICQLLNAHIECRQLEIIPLMCLSTVHSSI